VRADGGPAPRFSEDALIFLSTSANKVGCEYPRHLAEILMMVGSFERYSAMRIRQCGRRATAPRTGAGGRAGARHPQDSHGAPGAGRGDQVLMLADAAPEQPGPRPV
jgi:hypothetical protein